MISLEMNTTSRSTAKRCSLMPRIICPSTNAEAGALWTSSLMPHVAHDADVEVAIAVEDLPGVIGAGAAVEHGEGALAEELVEPSLTRVEQLLDLDLREVLEAAAGAHPGIGEFGNDEAAFHGYGRMSIGVPSCVSNQISTMSASETAMQPSVQSLCW